MIKYFCDFCKEEIPVLERPVKEVGITVSLLNENTTSRSTLKIDHICHKCNDLLLDDLIARGIEVQ